MYKRKRANKNAVNIKSLCLIRDFMMNQNFCYDFIIIFLPAGYFFKYIYVISKISTLC